ncbi:MAG: hypothetical protein WD830_02300 [Chloroflexota bacterium]
MRQQAPRGITIIVAVFLIGIGVVGTFLGLLPNVGGLQGETIGVISYVLATAMMLAGVFVRGL